MSIVLKKIFVKKKNWRLVRCSCTECVRDGVSGRGVIVRNGSKHGMQEVDVIISIIIRVPHLHLDFYASLKVE